MRRRWSIAVEDARINIIIDGRIADIVAFSSPGADHSPSSSSRSFGISPLSSDELKRARAPRSRVLNQLKTSSRRTFASMGLPCQEEHIGLTPAW